MTTNHQFELYEQMEDLAGLPPIRNVPDEQFRHQRRKKKAINEKKGMEVYELEEKENQFNFSYGASKHEKAWINDSLFDFYRQNWLDDILRLIKGGGKEASVYQCLANPTAPYKFIAAKVYRPRKFRHLRNDSLYREGRMHLDDEGHEIRDDRALHAIQKRTNFGKRLLHTSWIEHEFQTMSKLHEAGANIPEPFASGNNAILMAYIGWDDAAAPTLNSVRLGREEAQKLFDKAIENIEIMLSNYCVHGDLSAFNILYHEGDIFLIDFPQAIDPRVNRNAYAIFKRDISRLCEYFQSQGVKCEPSKLSDQLWEKYGYEILPHVDPRFLDADYDNEA